MDASKTSKRIILNRLLRQTEYKLLKNKVVMALIITTMLIGYIYPIVFAKAQESDNVSVIINGTVDIGLHFNRQSGINSNCEKFDSTNSNCAIPNYIGQSNYSSSLNRSNVSLKANKSVDLGVIGFKAQLFFANKDKIKSNYSLFLYSKKVGLFSFGVQDEKSDLLIVDHTFSAHDYIDLPSLIIKNSSKGRLFGSSFGAKEIKLSVYKKGLVRLRYTSLGNNGLRWQWSFALDSPDSSNKLSNMQYHLDAVIKYEYYDYNSDKNHFNYGVESSIAVATKLYRIPRSGYISKLYPISTVVGLRFYLNSFRIGIAGSLDLFAIDRKNGFGSCVTVQHYKDSKCLNRWSTAIGLAYFSPSFEYSLHVRGIYSRVGSTFNRDVLIHNQDADKTKTKLQTFGADGYYRVQIGGNYNIYKGISAYMELYFDKDVVASTKIKQLTTSEYVTSQVADSFGIGMQIGTKISF